MIADFLLPHADTPVHGEGHNHQQAIQPIWRVQLRVFELKTATLEVREHRFDGPARSVVSDRGLVGRTVHGDDPEFGVSGFMPYANRRRDARLEQTRIRLIVLAYAGGQFAGGPDARTTDIHPQVPT